MKRGQIILGLSTLAIIITTGCGSPPRERRTVVISRPEPVYRERVRAPIIVRERPPAVVREVRPPAPGRDYVWAPGYWTWDGEWLWQSGHWTRRPSDRAVWVEGRWVEDRRGEWVWQPGHWR
jgi:hypothetical protein